MNFHHLIGSAACALAVFAFAASAATATPPVLPGWQVFDPQGKAYFILVSEDGMSAHKAFPLDHAYGDGTLRLTVCGDSPLLILKEDKE